MITKSMKIIKNEEKDILNLKLNILGENNQLLVTATWAGKTCFYAMSLVLITLLAWNVNLLFNKEGDIFR